MPLLNNSWVKKKNHNKTTEAKGAWEGVHSSPQLCWAGTYMLVESSLSPSQGCARSRRSTSQQRWVACKIVNFSLISESCSNCYVWWLPSHKIRMCLFSFLSGMLWEWNPLLKHQALQGQGCHPLKDFSFSSVILVFIHLSFSMLV